MRERRLTFHVHLCHFAVQSLKIHFKYYAQIFVSLQLWTFEWNFIERRFQAQWFETSNAAWILHLWAQLWRKTSTPFSWQDFLVQYLERVQYSGFKPCAVSRVTRYKIYAIMSFLCCTYYPNRAVCTPLHGLQLTHCSIGSASLEFGFSISNQQGALVSLKPLAGYAAGVHYLLCE